MRRQLRPCTDQQDHGQPLTRRADPLALPGGDPRPDNAHLRLPRPTLGAGLHRADRGTLPLRSDLHSRPPRDLDARLVDQKIAQRRVSRNPALS